MPFFHRRIYFSLCSTSFLFGREIEANMVTAQGNLKLIRIAYLLVLTLVSYDTCVFPLPIDAPLSSQLNSEEDVILFHRNYMPFFF